MLAKNSNLTYLLFYALSMIFFIYRCATITNITQYFYIVPMLSLILAGIGLFKSRALEIASCIATVLYLVVGLLLLKFNGFINQDNNSAMLYLLCVNFLLLCRCFLLRPGVDDEYQKTYTASTIATYIIVPPLFGLIFKPLDVTEVILGIVVLTSYAAALGARLLRKFILESQVLMLNLSLLGIIGVHYLILSYDQVLLCCSKFILFNLILITIDRVALLDSRRKRLA